MKEDGFWVFVEEGVAGDTREEMQLEVVCGLRIAVSVEQGYE